MSGSCSCVAWQLASLLQWVSVSPVLVSEWNREIEHNTDNTFIITSNCNSKPVFPVCEFLLDIFCIEGRRSAEVIWVSPHVTDSSITSCMNVNWFCGTWSDIRWVHFQNIHIHNIVDLWLPGPPWSTLTKIHSGKWNVQVTEMLLKCKYHTDTTCVYFWNSNSMNTSSAQRTNNSWLNYLTVTISCTYLI